MFVVQYQVGMDWADDGKAEMGPAQLAKVHGVFTHEAAKEALMDRVFAHYDDDLPVTLKVLAVVDYRLIDARQVS